MLKTIFIVGLVILSLGTIMEPSDSIRPEKYAPSSLLLFVELFVDSHLLWKEDENILLEYNAKIH
jgi:hypothetical protein